MITQDSMRHDADAAVDIYSKLEQGIYAKIINTLKTTKFDTVDSKNVLRWQVEQLSKMGVLNKQVIALVAKYTGKSQQAITKLVHDNGFQIVNEIDATLSQQLHKKVAVDNEIRDTINSLQNQTWKDLDNTVNQSLLSTNYQENGAMRAYQGIIKQTTMETVVGLKTHERALRDNVYKWVDAGIKSNLVDKGGHNWSLEGYARTVINTTAHRTFNNLRLKRMQDFGNTLAVMSAHPASREACAYIQGHVVNLTEPGSDTYNAKYDSIYNHGYGTPAGTQGINCTHSLYPFIDGVNTNHQPQYDPQAAIAKGDIQAKQRGYERAIRQSKKKLAAAQKLDDDVGVSRYKSLISNQQKSLRELVKDHDFLHRDYSREQVYSKGTASPGDSVGLSADQKYTRTKLANGEWGKTINPEKQAPHMESTHEEGKSYFSDSVDIQRLLDKYSGTGHLHLTKKGYDNKEIVKGLSIPGVLVTGSGERLPITGIKIHHSKSRTHVVPYTDGDEK
ncbi:phage minor capsid protein [Lactiplantibacillus plantarum]|uniref:phage minor capsid protein n=1 Tax=Lactiplantibacillus plantarum TaxID=1590 RepID=UPI0039659C92